MVALLINLDSELHKMLKTQTDAFQELAIYLRGRK